MSWECITRSCSVIAYGVLSSASPLCFCISSSCSWTNPFLYWNTFLCRLQLMEMKSHQAWHFLRPFSPQIYATSHFLVSVFQRAYRCSPLLPPSSHFPL